MVSHSKIFSNVLWILVFSALTLQFPALAQSKSQPDELQAIYSCKSISNPDERLSCYDKTVDRFQTAQKSGEVVTVSKSEIEKVERDSFGFNIPSLPSLGKLLGRSEKSGSDATPEAQTTKTIRKAKKIKSAKAFGTEDIDAVELEIKRTKEFGYKKTRFFMANGQVWEQTDSLKVRIPKAKDDKANFAKISKASLGSFFLRVNGKGTSIRVRRVR